MCERGTPRIVARTVAAVDLPAAPETAPPAPVAELCDGLAASWPPARGDVFSRYDVLTLTDSDGRDYQFAVSQLPLMLGSGADAHIQLATYGVSREHCSIERDGHFIAVADCQSTNGTYLNGLPVTREQLRIGDQIMIGRCVLTLGSVGAE